MVTLWESVLRAATVVVIALLFEASPSLFSRAQLSDSTPLTVRLVGVINSETSRAGQSIEFVVMRDVIVDGQVVIGKDTLVTGMLVDARRARWGPTHRRPKLTFKFGYTLARDGQLVALRVSPVRQKGDSLKVDREGLRHELAWAGGADLFAAYVDGDYQVD